MTIIRKISRFVKETKRYRNTVRELSALTNRELADIGISRCDIHRIADEKKVYA